MTTENLAAFLVPGTDEDIEASYRTLAERALTTTFGFDDEIAVVDIETTGYDPDRDRIIELAAAIMRGPEIVGTFSMLVDPLVPIPSEITKLTGITDEMLAGQSSVESAVFRLVEFIGDRDIVAHNASFDRSFIERVAGRGALRGAWIDSLQVVRIGLPRLRSHRLTDLAAAFGVTPKDAAHRALPDVEALAAVWRIALVGLSDLPPGLLHRLTELEAEVVWPVRSVLSRVAAAAPPGSFFDLKETRRRRVAADKSEALHDAAEIECSCPLPAAVLSEFSEDGIAGRMYEGYEARAEQLEMAGAVLEAFGTRTHAAIEAGTGVGKSVAYLVPAALYSLENRVGVGVATKTNALMDQLVYHELPKLNAALGGELRYVALKGYDHYPCLRKLERYASELAGADARPARDHRRALRVVGAVVVGRPGRHQPALGPPRRARGGLGIAGRLHAQALPLLPQPLLPARGPQARRQRERGRHQPRAALPRRRRAGRDPAAHPPLDRRRGALGGERGPQAAHRGREPRRALGRAGRPARRRAEAACSRTCGASCAPSRVVRPLATIARMEDQVARCSTISDSLFDFVKDLAPLAGGSDYDSAQLWLTQETRETGPWGTVPRPARRSPSGSSASSPTAASS